MVKILSKDRQTMIRIVVYGTEEELMNFEYGVIINSYADNFTTLNVDSVPGKTVFVITTDEITAYSVVKTAFYHKKAGYIRNMEIAETWSIYNE